MNFTFETNIAFTNQTQIDWEIGGIAYLIKFLSDYLPYTLFNGLAMCFGIFGFLFELYLKEKIIFLNFLFFKVIYY